MAQILQSTVAVEIAQSTAGAACCSLGAWFIDEVEHLCLFFTDGERRLYIDGALRDTCRIKDQICSDITALQAPAIPLHHLLYCAAETLYCTPFEHVTTVAPQPIDPAHPDPNPSQKILAESIRHYAVSASQTALLILHGDGHVLGMDLSSWTRTFTWTPRVSNAMRIVPLNPNATLVCAHGPSGGAVFSSESTAASTVFPAGADLLSLLSHEMLLVKDNRGFLLSPSTAKPLRSDPESIHWPGPPLEVIACGPFVAARFKKQIQFHLVLTGEKVKETDGAASKVAAHGPFFYAVMRDGRVLRFDALAEAAGDFRRTLRVRQGWEACGRLAGEGEDGKLRIGLAKQLLEEEDFAAAVEQVAGLDVAQFEEVVRTGFGDKELSAVDPRALREFLFAAFFAQERGGKSAWLDTFVVKALVMDGGAAGFAARKREFILGKNMCEVKECERMLLQYPDMWEDLLWLYMSKQMHVKALEWLRKLDENLPDDSEGNASKYVVKAIEYMRRLGRAWTKVVVRFAPWVLKKARPQEAISMFIRPPPQVEPLEAAVVMDLLEMHDRRKIEEAAADGGAVEVERETVSIMFLRHLVKEEKEPKVKVHTKLASLLLQLYMQCVAVTSPHAQSIRADLVSFLKESKLYSAEDLIPHFKQTELYQEYALLLSRVGRHREALRIYISTLHSHEEALEYCEMVSTEHPDIFMELFNLYLEHGSQEALQSAMKVLEKYHARMDATAALASLRDDVPMRSVVGFISAAIAHEGATHRNKQVLKQLLRRQHLDVMSRLALLQRKHCVISRETTCANPGCQRRFQSDSAIARLPDGKIMHYACLGGAYRRQQ